MTKISSTTESEIDSGKETPSIRSVIPESFPEQTNLSSNLDPALDPELSSYFFGPQSHPPPYSKIDLHEDTYSQHAHPDDHHQETPWMSNYEAEFESYIALPLSSSMPMDQVIDPAVLSSSNVQSQLRMSPLPNIPREETSISIAPSMLDKSVNSPIQDETVWYSNGTAQVGGKTPPRTKHRGEGKGKARILGKRPAPPEVDPPPAPEIEPKPADEVEPAPAPIVETAPTPEVEATPAPHIGQVESPPARVLGTRYEMNVETGLDNIKRIKLVFHADPPQSSRPKSSGTGKSATDPIDVDSSQHSSRQTSPQWRHGKKRDILVRRDVPRVTPPSAIDVDVRTPLPTAKDLHLHGNTPPPTPSYFSQPMRWIATEVSIPFKHLDKSQYPAFLAQDAKQMMVKSKLSGQVKGISFTW